MPLRRFAIANRLLRPADLGFFRYASPTTRFVPAITVQRQPLSLNTLVSLVIIWIALGVVVFGALAAPHPAV